MAASPSRRAGVRRRSERDEGAAIAEFALVVPMLVLLLVGIIEFGAALNHQISVQGAAREGARLLALRNSASTVEAAVLQSAGLARNTAQVTSMTPCPAGTTSRSTALATVVVQSEFTFGIPFVNLGTRTITASAAMRCGL